MRFQTIHTTFEASAAEKITGVNTLTQRDWQRRGFFQRSGEERTDHDAHYLARLLVMRVLGNHGIGPATSFVIAKAVALRVEFFAMNLPSSIEDATDGQFDRALATSGRPRGS